MIWRQKIYKKNLFTVYKYSVIFFPDFLPNMGMIMYRCQNWVTKLAASKQMTDMIPAPKTTILWLSLFVNADEIGAKRKPIDREITDSRA